MCIRDRSISPVAFNVLLNLLAHWWKVYEWPHPSQESLAIRMSVSVRTV
ncbi:helix-turn-helix domain-containing protein, partial [Enterobacter cloacae]